MTDDAASETPDATPAERPEVASGEASEAVQAETVNTETAETTAPAQITPEPVSEAERAPLDIAEPGLPIAKVDYLYRVFCAKSDMPSIDALLTRLISSNPHNPEGSFIFPPPNGIKRLQDALGASTDYFVTGYLREEAPGLWKEAADVLAGEGKLLDERERLTMREAPLCVVIRAQIKNPENNEYVETLVHLADAFADLLNGVVWDVRMRQMHSGQQWRHVVGAPMSPLSHVRVLQTNVPDTKEAVLRTAGLQKFGSADLELCGVPLGDTADTAAFLLDASEHLMQGDLLDPGEVISYRDVKIEVIETETRAGENEVLRLTDAPDSPEAEPTTSDGGGGAPGLIAAIQRMRHEVEGQRAKGGLAAI